MYVEGITFWNHVEKTMKEKDAEFYKKLYDTISKDEKLINQIKEITKHK